MQIETPLVLVADKEYLESFQNGYLYMINSVKYQGIEDSDKQRGDIYDSAIKFSNSVYKIPDTIRKDAINEKLMIPATYIKCFYHYKESDTREVSHNIYEFRISESSAAELKSFNKPFALVILFPYYFIERFENACKKYSDKRFGYFYSDVQYIDEAEYPKYEKELIEVAMMHSGGKTIHPVFQKRKKYSDQQEFRIAITLPILKKHYINNQIILPESIGLTIDNIADISFITKLDNLIQNPLRFNINGDQNNA